ncbi:uncharacterized protein LOC128878485 isoform X1 [Hylaeus volcanicus]|uniref:uncharacterized protein LOC128878485 isoform X1 n=1 Tax=Hylaeus volcanicus TaxID=313075 RepID=UPI0023B7C344|nr:uncharacterized protein LOC128878485 isoform X1 [Hylaeus volcanicus]XP_053982698.1 uncharacterized protein LOC128878485 isoform X1 [Hylaeus volcanicus]
MNDFDANSQDEIFKPPTPKARSPLSRFNISKGKDYNFQNYDNLLMRDSMHRVNQQSKEYFDGAENDVTDDDDDDDNDNDYSDNNEIKLLNDSFHSVTLDSPLSKSYNSPDRTHLQNRSYRSTNTSRSSNTSTNSLYSYRRVQRQPITRVPKTSNYCLWYIIIAAVIIIIPCMVIFNQEIIEEIVIEENQVEENDEKNKLDLGAVDKTLNEKMEVIQTQFYNQKPSIWNDVSSGIYDIALYPGKPVVIILFGNETNTLNCLAQLLGQLSTIILGNNEYLTLIPQDFPNDVGQTIYKLKQQISQKRVVIVQDLLSINPEAIKAFHNFCDREKPLIKHAVYIITIIIDGYKPIQKELEFIEMQMMKKLSDKIEKDILAPLITRLMDGTVVRVLPESAANFKYTNCSLPERHRL